MCSVALILKEREIPMICRKTMAECQAPGMCAPFEGCAAPSPPAASAERPLDFFTANVDAWGASEWFERLAKAIHGQDAAVIAGDEMAIETCRNVAASSAMRLIRDFEPQVRAALSGALEPGTVDEALRLARAYLKEEANSGSIWSSIDSAKALKAIDRALADIRGGKHE
jgi:hypothetical protein